jgi:cytochrome c peroxidase
MTAPYVHDGSVDDLGRAVRIHGRSVQLGRTLDDADRPALDRLAFLGTADADA